MPRRRLGDGARWAATDPKDRPAGDGPVWALIQEGQGSPNTCSWANEASRPPRRYVIECKLLRGNLEATVREGVRQTPDYMDRCGAESGHLVVFDRGAGKPWNEKIFRREASLDGRAVSIWGA